MLLKKLRALHGVEDLEPLFKIFYTFVSKKVPGKIKDKYMENLKQASGEILGQVRPKNFSHVCLLVKMASKTETRSMT